MVNLCCFRPKDELEDLSAPLDPAIPKPGTTPPNGVIRGGPQQRREDGAQPAAASTGSAPGRHGASRFANGSSSAGPTVAAGSPDGTPSATSPIGATPAVRQGPYDTRMSPSGRGAAAAAGAAAAEEDDEEDNAGYGRARGHGQGRPPALQVPTSPPAQPKEASWGVTPMEEQPEANVDDIEVDMEEVQELSPIPSQSATSQQVTPRPRSMSGTPTPRSPGAYAQSSGFAHSPSNLGPGRKSAQRQGSIDSSDNNTIPRGSGYQRPANGSPPVSPVSEGAMEPLLTHQIEQRKQQQQRGAAADRGYAYQQGSGRFQGQASEDWDEEEHSSRQRHSQQQGRRRGHDGQASEDGSQDVGDDDEEEERNLVGGFSGSMTSRAENKGQQQQQQQQQRYRPAHGAADSEEDEEEEGGASRAAREGQRRMDVGYGEAAGAGAGAGAAEAGHSAAGPQSSGGAPRSEGGRGSSGSRPRSAGGPYAPSRPSPLGNGVRKSHAAGPSGLARQDSGMSDLSLPGEYERYGGGSSDEDEEADREYEQAVVAAGGQVLPHTGSRDGRPSGGGTQAFANPGEAAAAAAAAAGGRLAAGYDNPIWREPEEQEDEENASPPVGMVGATSMRSLSSRAGAMAAAAQQAGPSRQPSARQGSAHGRSLSFSDSDNEGLPDSSYDRGQQRPGARMGTEGAGVGGPGISSRPSFGAVASGFSGSASERDMVGGSGGGAGGAAGAAAGAGMPRAASGLDEERWGAPAAGSDDEEEETPRQKRAPMEWTGVYSGPAGPNAPQPAATVHESLTTMTTLAEAAAAAAAASKRVSSAGGAAIATGGEWGSAGGSTPGQEADVDGPGQGEGAGTPDAKAVIAQARRISELGNGKQAGAEVEAGAHGVRAAGRGARDVVPPRDGGSATLVGGASTQSLGSSTGRDGPQEEGTAGQERQADAAASAVETPKTPAAAAAVAASAPAAAGADGTKVPAQPAGSSSAPPAAKRVGSTATAGGVPHFMLPTRSAAAHRRSSEDGNTVTPTPAARAGEKAAAHPPAKTAAAPSFARSGTTAATAASSALHSRAATPTAPLRSSTISTGPGTASATKPAYTRAGSTTAASPAPAGSSTPGAGPRTPAAATAAASGAPAASLGPATGGKISTKPALPAAARGVATSKATPGKAAGAATTPATKAETTASAASAATAAAGSAPAVRAARPEGPSAEHSTGSAGQRTTHADSNGDAGDALPERMRPDGLRQPQPPAGAPPQHARLGAEAEATTPSTGQGSAALSRNASRLLRPEGPPPTASSDIGTTPPAASSEPATPPPERTSNTRDAPASGAGAAAGGGGALPYGEWRMVRLKKEMRCCAAEGTVAQETHDGELEVFQCEEVLQPGALAAVISHEVYPVGGGGGKPKTWVFCPDPLCMESRPLGSKLPHWPTKIILAGGVKVTRAEYDNLKGLGLDVTLPPKTPAAAAGGGAA